MADMSETSPFGMLNELAEKARSSAIELPSVQAAQTHTTGLGFDLLGQRFVASMDEVSELMRVPQVTRVPGVKNFVLGVGNVRGRLMTVIDLAMFFDQASVLPRGQRRVIAVEDEEHLIGFVIDDSYGMQHFPRDAFSEQALDVDDMFSSFVEGSYEIAGIHWPVLSLGALTNDPRLEKLAITP
jgi:twitching motility protein PilI